MSQLPPRSSRETSPTRWRRAARRVGWRALLLLAVTSPTIARAQDVVLPPTLLLPNYDRVFPGLIESLEGGAFIARARSAPAVFYNPAGIATAERTALNASAQGYQLTTIHGTGFEESSPVSSFQAIPSFVGFVLGREVIDWERVRLGFAVVNPVAWDQSVVATSPVSPGVRASYSVHSKFSTFVPTFSAGWALSSTFRLGASLEFPHTSLGNQGELSGENTDATTSRGALRALSAGGHTLHLVGVAGAQWAPLPWLELGLLLRSPGLKILSGGSFQYEGITILANGTRHSFFQDPNAEFSYRLPLQASLGAAVKFGAVQVEVDLRWHDGTQTYTLLSSSQEVRIVDTTSGVPVVTNASLPGVSYRAHQTWNGSLGGHLELGQYFTISAGAYLDFSPADSGTTVFRRVDLLGIRAGVSFQLDKLAASLGLGWEHGTASENLAPDGTVIPSQGGDLSLTTLSLLFSVSFRF
jgi:hypothetical protein